MSISKILARIALAFGFLISASCFAAETQVQLYESCVDEKGASFSITNSRAKNLPVWSALTKSEPPLSINSAVSKAAKTERITPENLFSVQLSRAFNTEVWYYVVTFLIEPSANWSKSTKSVTVLMDGSVVSPKPTQCR